MAQQDLGYALIQVVHNLGAVAVTGGAAAALWPRPPDTRHRHQLAWLVLAGWAIQAASGATFGGISLFLHGALPDSHGLALAALLLKMVCAAAGFALAAAYLRYSPAWTERHQDGLWMLLVLLALTALSAAAFLRWFS